MDRLDMPEVIQTGRLTLRRLRYEDAEEIFYAYASKPQATRHLAWATHRTLEDTRAFLDFAIKGWRADKDYTYAIVLKSNKQLIGSFGLIHDQGRVQFGYVISPTYWNQGITTEACKAVMDVLKTKKQLYRVSTFVDIDNVASIRVLLKVGFVKEATLHNWFRFVNQEYTPKDCVLLYLPLENSLLQAAAQELATLTPSF
jgi:[ribosomal protein S5]-alanine N-acetyltransferase